MRVAGTAPLASRGGDESWLWIRFESMDAKPEKKRDYEERMLFCSCCCLAIVERGCVCVFARVCVCVTRRGGTKDRYSEAVKAGECRCNPVWDTLEREPVV